MCTMQLCEREKVLICYQLCQAVMFLHTSEPQMAHLDIKPANIMVHTLTFCIYYIIKIFDDTLKSMLCQFLLNYEFWYACAD